METYDDRLFRGSVSEAAADMFVPVYGGSSTTLQYAEVRKVKWPSELSKQVKVAIEGKNAIPHEVGDDDLSRGRCFNPFVQLRTEDPIEIVPELALGNTLLRVILEPSNTKLIEII